MIVRCANCNSAFAVDDNKVDNKKFAFTCPKCDSENVKDNRKQAKRSFAGPAIVNEAYNDIEEPSVLKEGPREEAVVGGGREGFFDETSRSKKADRSPDRDMLSDDELMLEEVPAIDADDVSGLAEPERFGERETAFEVELPPADDMRSDIPLDDLTIDDEMRDLEISDLDLEGDDFSRDAGKPSAGRDSGTTTFEELGEELRDVRTDSELIQDELEPLDEVGEPVRLDDVDDIDMLLAEDEKEKEIVDDFKPFEEKSTEAGTADTDLLLDEEIKTEEMYHAGGTEDDDSITIDLDTLDIDLEDDGDRSVKGISKPAPGTPGKEIPKKAPEAADGDENITIDLDTLDVELQENGGVVKGESHEELDLDLSDFSDETIHELEGVSVAPKEHDDESITLDMGSLDISIEESDEILRGDAPDENEKLTLEDAGLTIDELFTKEVSSMSKGAARRAVEDEEDMRLSIDEIDPHLDMHAIESELKEAESILSESTDDDFLIVNDRFQDTFPDSAMRSNMRKFLLC